MCLQGRQARTARDAARRGEAAHSEAAAAVRKRRRALTAGLLLGTCLSPCTAWAANFDVTNGNDSGAGSLRQAIFDSNAAGGTNTITIAAGTTVTLSQSLPMITTSVTVTGNNNTLDANNAGRAFFVQSGTVAISNLTINNAVAQGGVGGGVTAAAAAAAADWAPAPRCS